MADNSYLGGFAEPLNLACRIGFIFICARVALQNFGFVFEQGRFAGVVRAARWLDLKAGFYAGASQTAGRRELFDLVWRAMDTGAKVVLVGAAALLLHLMLYVIVAQHVAEFSAVAQMGFGLILLLLARSIYPARALYFGLVVELGAVVPAAFVMAAQGFTIEQSLINVVPLVGWALGATGAFMVIDAICALVLKGVSMIGERADKAVEKADRRERLNLRRFATADELPRYKTLVVLLIGSILVGWGAACMVPILMLMGNYGFIAAFGVAVVAGVSVYLLVRMMTPMRRVLIERGIAAGALPTDAK